MIHDEKLRKWSEISYQISFGTRWDFPWSLVLPPQNPGWVVPARFWGFLQNSWNSLPRILLFCSRERGPEKIAAGRTITHVAAAQGGHKGWWVERNHMYIVSIWPGGKKNAFLSIYRWFLYTNQAFPRTVEKIFPKLAAQLLKSAFFVGLRWVPIYFQQILAWPTSISVAWTNERVLFQPCRSFQDSHLYFNPLLTST